MTVVEQLIDLQEVDGRIRELEHEFKDLPRRKALETARLSGVSADLEAAKVNLKQVLDRAKSYEADAEALREKIQQLKTAQASLTSNREYAQYSVQIDLVTHDLETTEQNWAAAGEYEPSARTRLEDAQAKFDSLKGSVDTVCTELDERLAEVKSALDEAMKERTEKVAAISDPQSRLYYERLLAGNRPSYGRWRMRRLPSRAAAERFPAGRCQREVGGAWQADAACRLHDVRTHAVQVTDNLISPGAARV